MKAATQAWVRTFVARLARRAILAVSSADRAEQMEGHLVDEGDPDYEQPVRRCQWYGLRSRPGPGTELICVAPDGGTSQRCAVAGEAPGTGPTDQEEWEVELYAKAGQRLELDKDGHAVMTVVGGKTITIKMQGAQIKIDGAGKIAIDSEAAQDVVVNGGTLKVARETDPVDPAGGMATWMSQVAAALNAIAPGSVNPPAPPAFGFVRTGAGAPRFRG